MDELISKKDAIEAINVWLYCDKDERMPADVIKALSPVQPEIIHCKDCKYWKEKPLYTYCEKMYRMGILDVLDYATEENDFCSMAEKRGEADG